MIRFLFSFPQWLRVLLSLVYLGVVAKLSMMPAEDIPKWELFPGVDKVVHGCMYFGFSILACWAFHTEENRKLIKFIVLFAISWGLLMEIAQLVAANRAFEWKDELSNTIGALIGAGTYAWIAEAFRRRENIKRSAVESEPGIMDRPQDVATGANVR